MVIRNGQSLNGTITNGVTALADGSRPKVGDVVKAPSGNYVMTAKGGVKSLLSTDYQMEANIKTWISFNGNSENVDPIFLMRLAAYGREHNMKISMNPTFRLTSEQQALYDKYGSPRAAEPGLSWHEYVEAVDVRNESLRALYGNYAATKDQLELLKYGIYKSQTTGNGQKKVPEDWHIQPIETSSVRYRDKVTKMSYYDAFH